MFQEIAPYTFHIEYEQCSMFDEDYALIYKDGKVLCLEKDGNLDIPTIGYVGIRENAFYGFSVDAMRFWIITATDIEKGIYTYLPIREIRNKKPRWKAFALAVGFQLYNWYGTHAFCGKCGNPLTHSQRERALCCSDCGNTVYPPLSPSVIVAITNKDKILLTKYQASHSPYRNYALIAGYVETGETVEDAVRREAMEEVGLRVKNIRYYKSQPWPFSGALLLGYFCEVDGDDTIRLQEEELEVAEWVSREDMPVRLDDVSLTSEMMEQFRTGISLPANCSIT